MKVLEVKGSPRYNICILYVYSFNSIPYYIIFDTANDGTEKGFTLNQKKKKNKHHNY